MDLKWVFCFCSFRIDPTGIWGKMDRFGLNSANILHSVLPPESDADDPGELSR